MSFQQKKRAMTPKGQMSGNGSGPAIMMMPPHIREAFLPNPPLKHLPPFKRRVLVAENYVTDDDDANQNSNGNNGGGASTANVVVKDKKEGGGSNSNNNSGPYSGVSEIPTSFPRRKRGAGISGVSSFLHHFERTAPPARKINPTPKSIKEDKVKSRKAENELKLAPLVEKYRAEQQSCGGEYTNGMNCYNTLFVGRLAYEVTERKLLRDMEAYGPVKDLKLITYEGKSRGYAFVEYEHEEDMKRAYRAADGMRLEGRSIVVDVERGHTVPNWLPRKFGGGLGGTRLGGRDKNVFMAGRFDPKQVPNAMGPGPGMGGMGPGPGGMNGGMNNGPPPGYGMGGGGGRDYRGGGGPPMGGGGRGPPPHGYGDRGGGGGGGGGYRGGPPPGYGGGGGGGYRGGGGYMGGGGYGDRGPPPGQYGGGYGGGGGYNNGPPPLAWERGGGGGGYGGDRKRRRSRSRSPERRRGRY